MRHLRLALALLPALVACQCDTEGGAALAGTLEVSASSLDFGSVSVGASRELTLTVTNDGSAALSVALAVEGEGFAAAPLEASIEPNAEASFTVTFSPAAPTPHAGTLRVSSNAEGVAAVEVALSGTGIEGVVEIGPASLDFGDAPRDWPDTEADDPEADELAPPQTITVRNSGTDVLRVTSASLTSGAGTFGAALAGLTGAYEPGASRSAEVTFRPVELGESTGEIVVTTDSPALPEQRISLLGRGIAAVLRLCAKLDDDAASERCLPSLPEDTGPRPSLDFGALPELTERAGRIVLSNEGNVPLALSSLRYNPQSPDLRLWADEARTMPLDPAAFSPTLCPAGVSDPSCDVSGPVTVFVDYRARGSTCCFDGVAECVELVSSGDCTDATDADEGQLAFVGRDPLFPFVSVVLRGRSPVPVIVVGDFDGSLRTDQTLRLPVRNAGEAPLQITGLELRDPAVRTCGPDGTGSGSAPCSCAIAGSPDCAAFRLETAPPLSLEAGATGEVLLTFLSTQQAESQIELHWQSTDPVQPAVLSTLTVQGLGP